MSSGGIYVVPKDIQVTFPQVIAHRLLLAPEAGARQITPEQLLDEILHQVPVAKTVRLWRKTAFSTGCFYSQP